jgi:hypothetical protein
MKYQAPYEARSYPRGCNALKMDGTLAKILSAILLGGLTLNICVNIHLPGEKQEQILAPLISTEVPASNL